MNYEEFCAAAGRFIDRVIAVFIKAWDAIKQFMRSKGAVILRRLMRGQKQRAKANHKPVMKLNKLKAQTYYPPLIRMARSRL